jgi:hypothetical protein
MRRCRAWSLLAVACWITGAGHSGAVEPGWETMEAAVAATEGGSSEWSFSTGAVWRTLGADIKYPGAGTGSSRTRALEEDFTGSYIRRGPEWSVGEKWTLGWSLSTSFLAAQFPDATIVGGTPGGRQTISAAGVTALMSEFFLAANVSWKPAAGLQIGLSAGPALGVMLADYIAWSGVREGPDTVRTTRYVRDSQMIFLPALGLDANVRWFPDPRGGVFFEAALGYRLMQTAELGGLQAGAELDASSWAASVGVGLSFDEPVPGSRWTFRTGATARKFGWTAPLQIGSASARLPGSDSGASPSFVEKDFWGFGARIGVEWDWLDSGPLSVALGFGWNGSLSNGSFSDLSPGEWSVGGVDQTARVTSSLNAALNSVPLLAMVKWRPLPGLELGLFGGPTLNLVRADALVLTRAGPSGGTARDWRRMQSGTRNEFNIGAVGGMHTRMDLGPARRWFLEATVSYENLDSLDVKAGGRTIAILDAASWHAGVGIGCRLGGGARLSEIAGAK